VSTRRINSNIQGLQAIGKNGKIAKAAPAYKSLGRYDPDPEENTVLFLEQGVKVNPA
jgi:hypothetical protein